MPGEVDAVFIAARRVLLDAVSALGSQRQALILIGAQAIYLHVGEGDLAVAPFTTDGDIALDPSALGTEPTLEAALRGGDFEPTNDVGIWKKQQLIDGVSAFVTVDLLVPESLGGDGRRGARLGVHGNKVARKVRGLEASLVDKSMMTITALEPSDNRAFAVAVAGPGALVVAKLHKISDRVGTSRVNDKDALDVLRILRAISTDALANRIKALIADPKSEADTRAALHYLENLFGRAQSPGSQSAARAVELLEDAEAIARSCEALALDLLEASRL